MTQFTLNIVHIPGVKNELCDFISRNNFNEKLQLDIELLAKEAFQKMDVQLDLRLEAVAWNPNDYLQDPHFKEIWETLSVGKSKIIEGQMFWRSEDKLFREKKICIPKGALNGEILKLHSTMGHPGAQRTFWQFLQR